MTRSVRAMHTPRFVISDTAVSFGRLARLFRDELRCRDGVLDGVVSSVWIAGAQRRDGGHELGPMGVMLDRRRAPESFARRVFTSADAAPCARVMIES